MHSHSSDEQTEYKTDTSSHSQLAALTRSHLPSLDWARGLAVGWVFIFHSLAPASGYQRVDWNSQIRNIDFSASGLLFALASFGVYGVAIFFAISGFCIQISFTRSKTKSWINFFVRRSFRIFPPYWFWLSIFSMLAVSFPVSSQQVLIGWKNVFAHAAALQNLREPIVYSINPSFWSLAIEWQLYLLFPVLLLLAHKAGWKLALLITLMIEVVFRFWAAQNGLEFKPSSFTPLNYWFSWAIGAYVGESFARSELPSLKKLPISFCVIFTLALWMWKPTSIFVFTSVSLTTAVWLVKQATNHSLTKHDSHHGINARVLRCLGQLGVCSYSFYLIHQPVVMVAGRLLEPYPNLTPFTKIVILLMLAFPIYLIALVSFRWIETPSHRLGKRLSA